MKKELHNYDVYPKVFIVGESVDITIHPLGRHVAFSGDYTVTIMAVTYGHPEEYSDTNYFIKKEVSTDDEGNLHVDNCFPIEGEYIIQIYKKDDKIVQLSVYALEEDMRGRYPYRGDLHVHSTCSDGSQAPEIVVSNYRKYGYDFMVISDHERYYPSLEAMDTFKDVPHELCIVCGEEVHLPNQSIHIVNFGGQYSVNGLIKGRAQDLESDRRSLIENPPPTMTEDEFNNLITEMIPALNIPDGFKKDTFAICTWVTEHIRNGGGLSIFAHPYWMIPTCHVPEKFTEYLLEKGVFDAFEVLGGEPYYQQNGFQTSRYYADCAKGIHYPIVGSTDSHNSIKEENRIALLASTFVFAKENSRESLIQAIKEEYSVAVDSLSAEYRLVGDFRLVKYARFILDEFTPLHDDLCHEDGRAMKAYVTGDKNAEADLKHMYGRVRSLFLKYFKL